MKRFWVFLAMLGGVAMMADTIVIRQPGLVEGVANAAFGSVRCVGEFASGLVCGNTTVVQTPTVAANTVVATPGTVVTAPGCAVVQRPVVAVPTPAVVTTAPVIQTAPIVMPYGGYYHHGYYYRPYHRRPYYRPCRPCWW